MKVITIGREYGAGGHSIGKRVAEELGIEFYDRDIIRTVVKQSGFEYDLVKEEGEEESSLEEIIKKICGVSSGYYNDLTDEIHEIQDAIIRHLAEKPCVILGRCADDILEQAGIDCVKVFIYADMPHRIKRVSELENISDLNAIKRLVVSKDSSRKNYYEHYTGRKMNDLSNYTLCLNSGELGFDKCVEMIINAVK